MRAAVACVLLAVVSSSTFALRDSYTEPRSNDRGEVVNGRYVAPNGDRNHIYNGKRVLDPGATRQGRDASPYYQHRNDHYRNDRQGNHMRGYPQRQR